MHKPYVFSYFGTRALNSKREPNFLEVKSYNSATELYLVKFSLIIPEFS